MAGGGVLRGHGGGQPDDVDAGFLEHPAGCVCCCCRHSCAGGRLQIIHIPCKPFLPCYHSLHINTTTLCCASFNNRLISKMAFSRSRLWCRCMQNDFNLCRAVIFSALRPSNVCPRCIALGGWGGAQERGGGGWGKHGFLPNALL